MAHLGSVSIIGGDYREVQKRKTLSLLIYHHPTLLDPNELNIDSSGTLSGIVSIASLPTANIRIGLFHRSSMNILEQQRSGVDGTFSFYGLDINDLKNYFIVFLDPQENASYNYSSVRDHLTPG